MQNIKAGVSDELDKEFILLCGGINYFKILEIEKRSEKLTKHQNLRVDSWVRIYNNLYRLRN